MTEKKLKEVVPAGSEESERLIPNGGRAAESPMNVGDKDIIDITETYVPPY